MISKLKKFFIILLLILILAFVILFFNVFDVSIKNGGLFVSLKEDYTENKIVMLVTGNTGNTYSASANPSNSKSTIDISNIKVSDEDKFLSLEAAILSETNERRAEYGLKPLSYSEAAENVAKAKTKEMFVKDYFAHTSPYTGDLKTQFSKWGSIKLGTNATIIGENIMYLNNYNKKEVTAEFLVDQWMNSEKHRENILNSNYTEIGIAVYYGDDMRCYAAQEFVTPIK